ncbi:methyltransferase-like protein 22 [Marchantia polymorpha subsp. ruderalis]|uniref:Methyltransferase-like protein 22 n=1 Tax=Marchantia polymorpha TaxID=3197 RepID=A0A2R6WN10_MARPO|nr:hypothetical protein MARPO_0072s0004 [Marchantia polymorpha]BBN03411.1 hypothetical protein Mp_2g23270 [Marchantia polymorpha subsp. ruderalis]|eukprot:PTQ35240.1 hypothetical protein MARPO_0072s0004 [Marchantia polymorpha]
MEDDDDSWLDRAEVMSEVHIGCSPSFGYGVSSFEISRFSSPERTEDEFAVLEKQEDDEGADECSVGTDDHGDLILPRRKKMRKTAQVTKDVISVYHNITTQLSDVGLQVWKGALLLSDFILDSITTNESFKDTVVLELGAGTGLTGIIMARYARLVFITDRGTENLDNCTRNLMLNSSSLRQGENSVRVRELDWHNPWPPVNSGSSEANSTYHWSPDDLRIAEEVSVLLAADVVYSPDLTDAFFSVLKALMPVNSKKVLYLAMEKRYNFSLRDQDVVAHGYKHFRSYFTADSSEAGSCEKLDVDVDNAETARHFRGRKIDVTGVRQYMKNYDRGKDLELWEIRRNIL